jgi:hypothetical protein
MSEKSDLHLTLQFLKYAKNGVSINNFVYQKSMPIYCPDASEFGMGSFNLIFRFAWHFELPNKSQLRTSLNSLEFIASIITTWKDSILNSINPESFALSQTNSSSTAGWMRKFNFNDDSQDIVKMTTARHLIS